VVKNLLKQVQKAKKQKNKKLTQIQKNPFINFQKEIQEKD
jgi:hypothetical protein